MASGLSGESAGYHSRTSLAVRPDFSNEVFSNKVNGKFDVSLFTFFELRPDTLYHLKRDV